MTDPASQTEDAREADDIGEKPDLGRTPDAMIEQLTGTDSGSDTRAGSLRGGSASGSDDDPDSDVINAALAAEGRASADPKSPASVGAGVVKNTGVEPGGPGEASTQGKRGGDADAATG
ncbi:hypothetical protein BH10PSE1_BH10PSE1_10370 [soil metagenome]